MNDKIEILFNGEKRELFMSFKRLNTCLRIVGNGEDFAGVIIDPDVGEMILQAMLADKGQSFLEVELDEDAISPADYEKILTWVSEHLMGFFTNKLQQAADQAQKLEPLKERLQKLSQTGSES
ncbi:MAG: hypothetical protein ACK4FG_01900 [Brevundimonas sp.]